MTDINVRVAQYASVKVMSFQGALNELITNALDRAGDVDWHLVDPDEPAKRVQFKTDPGALRRILEFFGCAEIPHKPSSSQVNPASMTFRHASGREVHVSPVSKARVNSLD
jgi:hypothetical protein